ncbi:MAG: hypothetical protein JWN66_4985 [Sphingomonas bacterium]|uniref:hypothetical protein n=1 Tax=Sphingomonas bacterium TaxID=1895847 RepID=UPI002633DAEC|nr:hypothetical protein [Sphingomonas bacterium]MDB5707869.1 hypothetical protein [Sphingomonas bacterium]
MSLTNFLRGIGGEFEIGRVLLTSAGAAAIFTPIGFQAWDMAKGGHFDVTAWCIAYPGGLAALVSAGILGIGSKDKSVATAIQTRDGTAAPATEQGS